MGAALPNPDISPGNAHGAQIRPIKVRFPGPHISQAGVAGTKVA